MAVATGTALLAAGAASAIGSAFGASKNAKAQSAALASQERANADNLAFQREQYQHERELTDPARYKFLKEATSDTPYGYEQTAAQINRNYATAAHAPMYNYGNGDSGMAAARNTALQMGRVSELAGAYRQGLDRRAQMLGQAATMGSPQAAASGVGQSYGNIANTYGQQAMMYGQAAQQGWQNAGSALNGLAMQLGSQNKPQADTNSGGGTPWGGGLASGGGGTYGIGTGSSYAGGLNLGSWGK